MYHILSISIVICQIKSHAFGYGHTRELGSRDKGMMGIRMQAGGGWMKITMKITIGLESFTWGVPESWGYHFCLGFSIITHPANLGYHHLWKAPINCLSCPCGLKSPMLDCEFTSQRRLTARVLPLGARFIAQHYQHRRTIADNSEFL